MTTPPGLPPPDPHGRPWGPPTWGGGGYAPPDHPKATTAMVLGIVGLVACQVLSPFAWVTGRRTVAEIDASGGRLGGRSQAQTGYVLGVVGTVMLGLALLFLVGYALLVVALLGGIMMRG